MGEEKGVVLLDHLNTHGFVLAQLLDQTAHGRWLHGDEDLLQPWEALGGDALAHSLGAVFEEDGPRVQLAHLDGVELLAEREAGRYIKSGEAKVETEVGGFLGGCQLGELRDEGADGFVDQGPLQAQVAVGEGGGEHLAHLGVLGGILLVDDGAGLVGEGGGIVGRTLAEDEVVLAVAVDVAPGPGRYEGELVWCGAHYGAVLLVQGLDPFRVVAGEEVEGVGDLGW